MFKTFPVMNQCICLRLRLTPMKKQFAVGGCRGFRRLSASLRHGVVCQDAALWSGFGWEYRVMWGHNDRVGDPSLIHTHRVFILCRSNTCQYMANPYLSRLTDVTGAGTWQITTKYYDSQSWAYVCNKFCSGHSTSTFTYCPLTDSCGHL